MSCQQRVTIISLYALLATLAIPCEATTGYLLFNGGTGGEINYPEYYNAVRYGYEVLKQQSRNVHVLSGDGRWHVGPAVNQNSKITDFSLTPQAQPYPEYPPISKPAIDLADLEEGIRLATQNGENSLFIYFSPHGKAPSNIEDPASAELCFWDQQLSYHAIEDVLRKYPQIQFKILTDACYGGGVHSLARNLPNVCTAATTNYFQPGYFKNDEFFANFWGAFAATRGALSLGAAVTHATRSMLYPERLALSSSDYIDFVLEKGPYLKGGSEQRTRALFARELPKKHQSTMAKLDDLRTLEGHFLMAPTLEKSRCAELFVGMEGAISKDLEKLHEQLDLITSVFNRSAPARYEELLARGQEALLDRTIPMEENPFLTPSALLLMKQMKDLGVYHPPRLYTLAPPEAAAFDLYKNGSAYQTKVRALREEFLKIKAEQSQEKYETFIKSAATDPLMEYYFHLRNLTVETEKLREFDRVATPEQKDKLRQMVECEWIGPLNED